MTPEKWQRLQSLFDNVLAHPVPQRAEALGKIEKQLETSKDTELLHELRRLLQNAEPGSDFMRPVPIRLPESSHATGDLIGERFKVLHLLGRGGMGEVFAAWDQTLQESVAIKFIVSPFADHPNMIQRFQREVQVARRISHPNICRIHDLGEFNGTPYISMELVDGETLAARLKRGPLPYLEWERTARQLFSALGAAHSAGIIHRDLKPSNLLLSGDRLVIMDFGLAKPVELEGGADLTNSGVLVGTLDWMAPEQLRGEADERTDLYAAALILLASLDAKLPHGSLTGLKGALHRATDANLKSSIPSTLPRRWRQTLAHCLDANPDRRFRSAEEVKRSLTRWRPLVKKTNAKILVGCAVAAGLFLSLLGGYSRYFKYPSLSPGSLIMIASTINTTDNPSFDGITAALDASLEQSRFVNVWDRRRLGEALRSIGRDRIARPHPEDWREMAFREHASLLVFSTLSPVGGSYSLAIQCEQIGASPEPARSWNFTVTAAGPAAMNEALREAAAWLRSRSGETEVAISDHNRLPQDITTSNWEALGLLTDADRFLGIGQDVQAISVLRRAVNLDPHFALGLMRLGDVLVSQRNSKEGLEYWRKAIEEGHSRRLSAREQLIIESRYSLEIGDFAAAEPALRQWVREFPNDPRAGEWLMACLVGMGQYPEVVALGRDHRKQFGASLFSSARIIQSLALSGRLKEVELELPIVRALPSPIWTLRFHGAFEAAQEHYDAAQSIFQDLRGSAQNQDASRAVSLLAALAAERGDIEGSAKLLLDGIDKDRQLGEAGLAAQKASALAFLRQIDGRREDSRAWALESARMLDSPQIIMQSVSILSRLGFLRDAERVAMRMPSGEGPLYQAAVLRMHGEMLTSRGESEAGLSLLEQSARLDNAFKPKEYLARAFSRAGRDAQARIQYAEIVAKPWLIWGSPESEWPGLRLQAKRYLQSH